MAELKENPFVHMGEWYWFDERERTHGPFKSQSEALFSLLSYMYPDYNPYAVRRGMLMAFLIELPFVLLGAAAMWWWMHS